MQMPMTRSQPQYQTFEPPPYVQKEILQVEDELIMLKPKRSAAQRSAPKPKTPQDTDEEEAPPIHFKKERTKTQRAAALPKPAIPLPAERKVEIRRREVEVDKVELIPNEREVVYYDINTVERTVNTDRVQETVRQHVSQIPQFIERIITKDVPVPNFIKTDRIVEKVSIREVYVDKVITKEIPVPVERLVLKEVPVYVDKIVDRIVYIEVFVDKVITKEVPVEVERIEYREVHVPIDKYVDKVVEVPQEKIVFRDKIVYQDRIVYNDTTVEVPIERNVTYERAEMQHYHPLQYQYTNHQQQQSLHSSQHLVHPPSIHTSMSGSVHTSQHKQGHKVGLGLVLRRDDLNHVFVKEVIPGFAAQRQGGVQVNDVIVTVDGKHVDNLDLEDIKHLTVGDEGTAVLLALRRNGTEVHTRLQRTKGETAVLGGFKDSHFENSLSNIFDLHSIPAPVRTGSNS